MNLLQELDALVIECSEQDWDGYSADPINLDSVRWTRKLIDALMLDTPKQKPTLSVDPDGSVSLTWGDEPKKNFTVCIMPGGKLAFAGLLPGGNILGKGQLHEREAN